MPATLTATTTTSRVALAEQNSPRAIVANDGPNDCYVTIGTSSVTATTSNTFLKVGNIVTLGTSIGTSANVAAITAAGTAALRISSPGAGAQYNAGPTGASG